MRSVIFLLAFLLISCGGPSRAAREACYAKNEARAAERAATECQNVAWEDCPSRVAILEELQKNHAECP